MGNRRGEIATLLTLGLVLVGGLVTLATSFIVNRQNNLGSNPRAGLSCPGGSTCYTTIDSCSQINKTSANAECIVGVREGICCKTSSSTGPTSTPKPSPTPTGKAGSGNQWPRDPTLGYDATGKLCPNTGLEYACCVQYNNQCNDGKDPSYTWYGCTGQPCGNTKISQSNGPGKLVACIPNGVDKTANKSCAVAAAPTPGQGKLGGRCIQDRVGSTLVNSYYCIDGSTCSNSRSGGTCVKPSATPRLNRTPTPSKTPTPTGTAGLTSGKGSGTTCYPPSKDIAFGFKDVPPSDNVTSSLPCGGVPVYNNNGNQIIRDCPTGKSNTCQYACFTEDGKRRVSCTNDSTGSLRKITVVNNTGKNIEIEGFIIRVNTNYQYPINTTIKKDSYFTYDFSNSSEFAVCKQIGRDPITLRIFYREEGDDVFTGPFEQSDECEGLTDLTLKGDVNILINLTNKK